LVAGDIVVNFLQTQHKRTEALHVSDELVMKADGANKKQELSMLQSFILKNSNKNFQTSTIWQGTKKNLHSKVFLFLNSFSKHFKAFEI
jgi:hypothetical protein